MKVAGFALVLLAFALAGDAEAIKFEDPKKLPKIPEVLNADSDGLPQLPELSNEFSDTVSGIDSEVAALRGKLHNVQAESRKRLSKQKKIFDRKLKEQEMKNKVISKQNTRLAQEIMAMKKGNGKLLHQIGQEEKDNSLRKNKFKALEKQLVVAKALAHQALNKADDSNAPELAVLKELHSKPKKLEEVASFLQVKEATAAEVAGESENKETSEVEAEVAEEPEEHKFERKLPEEPESLVTMLSGSIKALRTQSKKSEAKLRKLFQTSFKAGVRRRAALLAQQKQLKINLKEMKDYDSKLKKADKRLKATAQILEKEIASTAAFLGKLQQVAKAPATEASASFKALHKEAEKEDKKKDSSDEEKEEKDADKEEKEAVAEEVKEEVKEDAFDQAKDDPDVSDEAA
eukprot:TRINITY_DN79021_c0_g1_i1.p1 TRINITY_DN79021_c0_g1~~TRINITY_DN79021_c0_g1_i1.p1  ORF type:complete len:404 (+),score=172.90 TRINITY_DN79021_c0_g1_i1:124-1335(+)